MEVAISEQQKIEKFQRDDGQFCACEWMYVCMRVWHCQ